MSNFGILVFPLSELVLGGVSLIHFLETDLRCHVLEKCRASRSEWSVSNLSPEDTVGELGVSAFGDSPFHPVSAQKLR